MVNRSKKSFTPTPLLHYSYSRLLQRKAKIKTVCIPEVLKFSNRKIPGWKIRSNILNEIYILFYFLHFIDQPRDFSLCVHTFCHILDCMTNNIFQSIFIHTSILSHSNKMIPSVMCPMIRIQV